MTSTMAVQNWFSRGTVFHHGINYVGSLIGIGLIYFDLAQTGLTLASIHHSSTLIWPPTGVALAAVLLLGYRIWPAIFVAALVANALTVGTLYTATAIAVGNTLEAMAGAYLINHWSGGRDTFATPNS